LNHGATSQDSNSAVVRQFIGPIILTDLRRLGEASKADPARHVNLTQSAGIAEDARAQSARAAGTEGTIGRNAAAIGAATFPLYCS
jgi:hypothetical protein